MTSILATPWAPRGRVASTGEVTTVTATFTAETLYGGINDFSVTAVAGRRYEITVKVQVGSDVAGDTAVVSLRDNGSSAPATGSTVIVDGRTGYLFTGSTQTWVTVLDWAPTAGQHRLAVSARRSSGTGNITLGDAARGSVVIVKDIGPT